jgi:hypothetical protein
MVPIVQRPRYLLGGLWTREEDPVDALAADILTFDERWRSVDPRVRLLTT